MNSSVDISQIAALTAQLASLNAQMSTTTDATVKALLQAQANMLTAQIQSIAQHAQAQIDASNNLLNGLGLFETLNQVLAGSATQIPSILSLFKK